MFGVSSVSLDPHALKIYIDGSALKNPGGAGGVAGIVVYPDDANLEPETIFQVGYQATTNQRMELLACIRALQHVRKEGLGLGVQRVQIVTDSLYVYRNQHVAPLWKRDDWKTKHGKPVDNHDLWKEFLSVLPKARARVRTEIVWRKGKTTPILKQTDRSAKSAAALPWKVDRGFRSGKIGTSKLGGKVASRMFPAQGQEIVMRVYRSGLVGRQGHKIYFEQYATDTGDFVGKFHAFTTEELASQLHRGHWYKIRLNSNPNYALIELVGEIAAP